MDSGIESVAEFVEPFLESIADQILASGKAHDPKSRLQEWVQSQGNGAPTYKTISSRGPDHAKIFNVEVVINGRKFGHGTGHSKQSAAKAAASEALVALGVDKK
jgi:ribonuclease-3